MSYTGSQAQSGLGSILSVNTGTVSTPTWTVVNEVADIVQNGYENETDDVTNMQSSAREFIGTILNPGTWEITMNRVSTNTGQAKMVSLLNSAATGQFQIQLVKNIVQTTTGDLIAFSGIVQKYPLSIKPDKAIKVSATIKVSNAVTITEGS